MRIRSKGIFQFLAPVVAVPAPLRAYGFTSLTLIGDQGSGRRKEKTGVATPIKERGWPPRFDDDLSILSYVVPHHNIHRNLLLSSTQINSKPTT
jgi:hypothetical protein